jgi:hypothetical protein
VPEELLPEVATNAHSAPESNTKAAKIANILIIFIALPKLNRHAQFSRLPFGYFRSIDKTLRDAFKLK